MNPPLNLGDSRRSKRLFYGALLSLAALGAPALAPPAFAQRAAARAELPPQATRTTFDDDAFTSDTITNLPVRHIPIEKEFFTKELDYRGVPIKGPEVVDDKAFYEAWRRLHHILRNNPQILTNLRIMGCEVHIIGKNQGTTDLPEFRSRKGLPLPENPNMTLDERARGMGGRDCSVGEENLLMLPQGQDRYFGRDILSHEFTHTIHAYGVSQNIKELINTTWKHAVANGLWLNAANHSAIYAGSNDTEYIAELMLWYVGGHGDWPRTAAAGAGGARRGGAGTSATLAGGRGRGGNRGTSATLASTRPRGTNRGTSATQGRAGRAGRGPADPNSPIMVMDRITNRQIAAGKPAPLPARMTSGPEFIKMYDPDGYALVSALVQGKLDIKQVQPLPRGRQGGGRRGRGASAGTTGTQSTTTRGTAAGR